MWRRAPRLQGYLVSKRAPRMGSTFIARRSVAVAHSTLLTPENFVEEVLEKEIPVVLYCHDNKDVDFEKKLQEEIAGQVRRTDGRIELCEVDLQKEPEMTERLDIPSQLPAVLIYWKAKPAYPPLTGDQLRHFEIRRQIEHAAWLMTEED